MHDTTHQQMALAITIRPGARRYIHAKRAIDFWCGLPPHHKKVLLAGLGCGFVPIMP